jgi:hypothetical protein
VRVLTERPAAQAKEVIGAADTSGGGKLDRDEFFTFLMANKTHADVGSFRVGDHAVWLKSDVDIPDGTVGMVCGFKVAVGGKVIGCPSPLDVLEDTCDISCY